MIIGAIWAQAKNGALGKDGKVPWDIPAELEYFRAVTTGHPVIMGRGTWDSLPQAVRPLPERTNIVITKDEDFTAAGAHIAHSPEEALELARTTQSSHCWVIGGGDIYREMLPLCDVALVTQLDIDVDDADVFAPEIPESWVFLGKVSHAEPAASTFETKLYAKPTAEIELIDIAKLLTAEETHVHRSSIPNRE